MKECLQNGTTPIATHSGNFYSRYFSIIFLNLKKIIYKKLWWQHHFYWRKFEHFLHEFGNKTKMFTNTTTSQHPTRGVIQFT